MDGDGYDAGELFEQAAQYVAREAAERRLPDAELLRLYAWYKQATVGRCVGGRPGLLSLTARRKWDAWHALGDLPRAEAAASYVRALTNLRPEWRAAASGGAAPRGLGIVVSKPCAEPEAEPAAGRWTPFDLVKAGRAAELAQLPPAELRCDAADAAGLGLLHWAADRGHADVVRLLLARGATVDLRDPDGQTPLHYASSCQHAEAVRALVEAGADLTARDGDGLTPAEVAASEIRHLLMAASSSR